MSTSPKSHIVTTSKNNHKTSGCLKKKNPPRTTLLARYQNIVLYTECIRLLEVVWRQVWGKLPRCECSLVSGGQSERREGRGGLIVKVALIWKTLKFKETPLATGRRTAQRHEGNRGRRGEASKIPPWNSPLWFSILVLVRSKDETLTWTTPWVSTSEVCTVKRNEKIPASAALADWTYSPEFSFTSLMKSA